MRAKWPFANSAPASRRIPSSWATIISPSARLRVAARGLHVGWTLVDLSMGLVRVARSLGPCVRGSPAGAHALHLRDNASLSDELTGLG